MRDLTILSVFGTRPDAVKMCPLVRYFERCEGFKSLVCLTGQHRQMLDQVVDVFKVKADYDLNVMKDGQTLVGVSAAMLAGMEGILLSARPDLVLVHGDTATSVCAALAAFYMRIPVGHVEAGLRSGDKYSPFPEEMVRRLIGRIAELHFCPTHENKKNLQDEDVTDNVYVTGNTVIDSFQYTVKEDYIFHTEVVRNVVASQKKIILMTAHRRENLGAPLEAICRAVREFVSQHEDIELVYPVHMNPIVREIAFNVLGDCQRIHLVEPIDAFDMHNLMAKSFLVMTDSGGLQEEAPAFGVPVLLMRTETERPEGVMAGTVKIVGVREEDILLAAERLYSDDGAYAAMGKAVNPYGDGHACERISGAIMDWIRNGRRLSI